jgi:hypothetical protein
MKRRSSNAPAVIQDGNAGLSPPQPELCPPSAARKPRRAGTGLIFGVDGASPASWRGDAAEADDVGKTAQLWGWCEWVRMSLVAAALMAGGIVMAAQTAAQRAHVRSTRLQYASASPPTRAAQPAAGHEATGPATIGAIHYWSDDDSTTVTVDLDNLVFFEAHSLTGPDRVYFDLQATRMPADLHGRLIQVGVGETFVRTIRVAERGPGITRVVLETAHSCVYSAMIAPDPYRLIVKLHAPE